MSADCSISSHMEPTPSSELGPDIRGVVCMAARSSRRRLRAAAATVDPDLEVHSLRSYFIRRGDHTEPIRFEVDRIRNGRSFSTRRVIARQAIGAILNLEASFQRPEPSFDLQTIAMDAERSRSGVVGVGAVVTVVGGRRFVPRDWCRRARTIGAGSHVGVDEGRRGRSATISCCIDAGWRTSPTTSPPMRLAAATGLDRRRHVRRQPRPQHLVPPPSSADEWHLHDFSCHSYGGGRGLAIGHVFAADGAHVATVAQEVLLRGRRSRTDWRPCHLIHSRAAGQLDRSTDRNVHPSLGPDRHRVLRQVPVRGRPGAARRHRCRTRPAAAARHRSARRAGAGRRADRDRAVAAHRHPRSLRAQASQGLRHRTARRGCRHRRQARHGDRRCHHHRRPGRDLHRQLRDLGAIVDHVVCVIDRSPDHGAALAARA